jgi:hypothetical protein
MTKTTIYFDHGVSKLEEQNGGFSTSPTTRVLSSTTGFICTLSTVAGTAFISNPSIALPPYINKKITLTAGGKTLVGWLKSAGAGETLGSEIATGTLSAGLLYQITATQTNHFGTGLVIGSFFTSAGTETCDANNKVKQVLTASATGARIVSTSGGATYNWASNDGINPNSASFTVAISLT